jgi:biopolymer transport protein ExbB
VETYLHRFVLAGGVMMVFLIPTSIVALALILGGLIDLRREKLMPSIVERLFRETKSIDDLRERLKVVPESPLSRVCQRLLAWVGMRGERWDLTVQQVTSEEVAALYQRHSYLAVVYGVAPLMGLLGTILGMIRTFYQFSLSETRSVAELSQGINEALVTTMWGLMIAVPAYLFVSLFRQRLYRYENDLIPARVRELFAPLSTDADQSRAAVPPAPAQPPAVPPAKQPSVARR